MGISLVQFAKQASGKIVLTAGEGVLLKKTLDRLIKARYALVNYLKFLKTVDPTLEELQQRLTLKTAFLAAKKDFTDFMKDLEVVYGVPINNPNAAGARWHPDCETGTLLRFYSPVEE
ncbi:hypothetical protein LCGC14_2902820 [marine sediment metagenome]|uniref:Uncharacterized protein n=1 Tax=marine sediment metagenome TaxID=412755 RepID=A0A0F8XUD5_9ZZZZ